MHIQNINSIAISRFNRYIVECKSSQDRQNALLTTGFNRYIVECKSYETQNTKREVT